VAVVVSQLGFGGAERQTIELLRELRGTPWAPVRVICLSTNTIPYADAVRDLGYPLSIVPRAGGFDVARGLALHRLLQQDRTDVVHAVNWFASGYSVLARPRRARVISSIRNSHLPAGLARRVALPVLIRRSAGVLVNSERGRQLVMETCKVPPCRVTLVPNGINLEHLRNAAVPGAIRRELSIPAQAPVVAYVGRNARVKNMPRLLGVARLLLDASPDVRIVLAGEGLDPRLVAGTVVAGEARIHCLGPRRDIPSLLRDATVLVLTSDNEGMPNVVLEALASGLPVVATDVGDLAQMLPPGCGALVPPETGELAAAILRVLAEAPAHRRAAEQYAPSIAAAYSFEAVARRTVDAWAACARRADRRKADPMTTPLDRAS
jgi:glycosyltransferase involved in cell wall biosynthesis